MPESNIIAARALYAGAKTLLKSVSIDIDVSRYMRKPLQKRTHRFLGIDET